MNRIAYPDLGGENALFRNKRDRLRKRTRFIRHSTFFAGLVLGLFSLIVWLSTPIKKKISMQVRWVCLGLSLTFLIVPGLVSFWIWFRFRRLIHPKYTQYGHLKDYQFESSHSREFSSAGGWEGFWEGTTLDKAQLIWLNFAHWALSLRGRQGDHDASIEMEASRGERSQTGDLETVSGTHGQEGSHLPSGYQQGNSHEMSEPPSMDSQPTQTPTTASRFGAPLEFWKYGPNTLLSDPWRLGLTDTRVNALPDTNVTPSDRPTQVIETGIDIGFRPLGHTWRSGKAPSSHDRGRLSSITEEKDQSRLSLDRDDMSQPSTKRSGRSHSVPETSDMQGQQEAFATQDRTQPAIPSPLQQHPQIDSLPKSTGGTRVLRPRHSVQGGIMRRIRLLRPGVELYRRVAVPQGPSARLERLAAGKQAVLQPEVAEFVLDAQRRKFFEGM